jgi:hypothetical protein
MSEPEPDLWDVLIKVRLDMDISREHRRSVLEEYVAPEYTELPGFLLASWMNDGNGTGLCLVDFDSEEHARDAVDALTAHGGPEVIECGVYAVEFEASG